MASTKEIEPRITEKPEPHISEQDADVTYTLLKSHGHDFAQGLDAAGQKRLNRKLYWGLVPLLVVIDLVLFVCDYPTRPLEIKIPGDTKRKPVTQERKEKQNRKTSMVKNGSRVLLTSNQPD